MARVYDIISRLENGNQKPVVKIDAEHEFKINNSKAAAFRIMALADDEEMKESERIESIIKIGLGKEAFDYIESLELSMPNYSLIINAIMAAIGDVDLEEVEQEAEKAKKGKKKPRQ
ncbi:hypothetical protein PMY38_11890 [Clostridium tertium]|uniref:hypothetical protein n=1 Tax=Clostridium tertium TaxID=1559 RepID=UPI00232DE3B2|nr:hypothetical protein [Clostridium tertium]MBS6503472.1 hypothetical protein [Clostridium sp.]MDB1956862.1 hypothetical protein [Clostridium tertium]MDB1959302.1 hypothetical protein [Clostridium tertium]MDB1963205.1 hypothetical protein [Clostridium tertium]MDB1967883.1 hypothetical protein [Clostridium tertium]